MKRLLAPLLVVAGAAGAQVALPPALAPTPGSRPASASTPAPPPVTGPASVEQWGLFARVAEQEFGMGPYLITFRWITPDRLDMVFWAAGGHDTTAIVRDPATGQLEWMNLGTFGLSRMAKLRVEADGSVSRAMSKDRYEPWLTAAGDGDYQLEARALEVPTAGSKRGLQVAQITAQGKLRPANPALIAMAGPVRSGGSGGAGAMGSSGGGRAWSTGSGEGGLTADGEVRQTPSGAHRFLATLADQGSLDFYYHYRTWPAYMLSYKITSVAENGDCRTMFGGRADAVQMGGWPIYRAGTSDMAYGMKEFGERYSHKPLPWTVDWSKVTSIVLTGSTAQSSNDEMTVLVTGGGIEMAVHLPDQAMAKRVKYAMTFLKESCDKTADTGF